MSNIIRRTTFCAALSLASVAALGTPAASAQTQSINGTIHGSVTDSSGAAIPGATVILTNVDTGFIRQVKTGEDGSYNAPNLPLGTYSVSAIAAGFAPLKQTGIHIEAGTDAVVNEEMRPGSEAQEITVTSDAPILEATRVDLGRTISVEEVQNLPLTSRNPYNFILFQPGVSGHPNAENGIPRTLNTNGLVDRVNYQLDGMVDTETDRYGLRLFAISDSYVHEVQTISNSFAPEFGNTAGIIYNVVTGYGTNSIHGTAQYIWRPKAASSCPILQNCDITAPNGKPKPDLHVDDWVGNVGAPIIKGKLFLFTAYEHLKRANPQAVTITPATQASLVALGVAPSVFNTAPSAQRAQWFNVRADWTINKRNQFFVRYNYFRNTYPFNTNVGGLYALDSASDFRDRAHIIGTQLITTFSPTLLNEFRASWPYRNQHHQPDALTGPGPMITISGLANFAGTNAAGDRYQEKIPSFNDNLTWIKGAHAFKFGTGFQKNLDTQFTQTYLQYTFASIAQYQSALKGATPHVYSNVKASIGQPGAAYHSIFFDFFAQDTWQIGKSLSATYGIRYDQYRAPTPPANEPFLYTQSFRTPLGDFAPRLGFAYSPTSTTVVRLSSGLYYEATPTNSWFNPLYNNGAAGTGSFVATISGASSEATANSCQPAFPKTPQSIPATCLGTQSITALTPKFKNEYTWNFNLQVAQELAKNDQLTLGYIMTNGRNMQFQRNMNLINPTGYLADGRPVFSTTPSASTRLHPQFNNITLIDIGSNSSYNAFTATYEHRQSVGLTTSASYTWSHAISNTPEGNSYEFSTPVEDPANPKRDRGNSGVNRPNSLTLSAVYEPQTKFENRYLNGIFKNNNFAFLGNLSSGDPQTITVSQNLNGDATATSRPLFIGRNTVTTPSVYQFDLRYTRSFGTFFERIQPKILIECNNLANHSNFTSINTTAVANSDGSIKTAPTLAPTSTLLESRILQFGAKIDF